MKLKVCTWNISEGIEGTCNLDSIKEKELSESNLLNSIIPVIKENDFDIVCFQEFPVDKDSIDVISNKIVENTELKYFILHPTCPSYLFKGGNVGVALFSKYPLSNINKLYFKNPNLEKVSKSGHIYHSFDKGIICASINIDGTIVSLVTGHAIAFLPFGCTEFDYPESYIPLEDIICEKYKSDLIVMGDFNTDKLYSLIPSIKGKVIDTVNYNTTYPYYENRGPIKVDYILISSNLKCSESYSIDSLSDHLVCVSVIEK